MKPSIFFFLLCIYLFGSLSFSQNVSLQASTESTGLSKMQPSAPEDVLKVGVITTWPFAGVRDGLYSGLSYEIWALIAAQNSLKCKYINLNDDVEKGIQLIRDNKLDVIVGPMEITSRQINLVNFTVPYFRGQYVLLSKKSNMSLWARFNSIFGGYSLRWLIGFCILYIIYLNVFWYLERNEAAELKGTSYKNGMEIVVWKSIFSKCGAPFFPYSFTSRILSTFWHMAFKVCVTIIVAGFTTALISGVMIKGESFANLSDVGKSPIATYDNIAATRNAKLAGLNVAYETKSMSQAISALDSKAVDAVFLLLGQARAYLNTHSRNDLYISPIEFQHTYLGFMVSDQKTYLLRRINSSILKMTENGVKLQICGRYDNYIALSNCQ